MNPVNRDPGDMHFKISIAKSSLRLMGCAVAMVTGSMMTLACTFFIAEVLGIYEEIA